MCATRTPGGPEVRPRATAMPQGGVSAGGSCGRRVASRRPVPKVSEFFGIVIALYYVDHAPPHFHATYGEHEAVISIDALAVLRGSLPRRALALVLEWATLHAHELRDDWQRARQGLPLAPIAPLD
jgi:hypothetical protein